MANTSERLQQLQRIADVATLAGIKGRIDEARESFVASFTTGDERSQVVHVRPTVRTPKGQQVVTFVSPCRVAKKGFLRGLSKDDALELLKLNERVPFARFGVLSGDEEDMVVTSVDHILDTLDAAEFFNHCWAVATAADGYERKHGDGDRF
jgi:hypothetical protein